MNAFRFRRVTEDDAAQLLDIYAPYVVDSVISFEYEVPSEEDFKQRIRSIAAEYPYFVCEMNGQIIGYAYAHRHMERAAYQWNAEISIYIRQGFTGKGLGKKMCQTLVELLRLQGIRNVFSCVTIPNERSVHLHQSMEFSTEGIFQQAGYKCGKWQTIAWFRKNIAPYTNEPASFLPISRIAPQLIDEILEKSCL